MNLMLRKDVVNKAREMMSSLQKIFLFPASDETDLPNTVYNSVAYVAENIKTLELKEKLKRGTHMLDRRVRVPIPGVPLLLWLDCGLIVEGMFVEDSENYDKYHFTFESGWLAGGYGNVPRRTKKDEKYKIVKWCYLPTPEELSTKWEEVVYAPYY